MNNMQSQNRLFEKAISQCLKDYKRTTKSFSVGFIIEYDDKEKAHDSYEYTAIFLYGPFNENKITLCKKYFRPFTGEELVNLVFNALSSCQSYHFSFKLGKFVKQLEYY